MNLFVTDSAKGGTFFLFSKVSSFHVIFCIQELSFFLFILMYDINDFFCFLLICLPFSLFANNFASWTDCPHFERIQSWGGSKINVDRISFITIIRKRPKNLLRIRIQFERKGIKGSGPAILVWEREFQGLRDPFWIKQQLFSVTYFGFPFPIGRNLP